jgi:wobble nucleotide-excising tRNase
MLDHEAYLAQLNNIAKFKEDTLKSYLRVNYDLYDDLMKKIDSSEVRKKQIEEEAEKQRTQWEEVIGIFNERFVVPFKLEAKNRTAVMLGEAPIVELGFTYHDGEDSTGIEKAALLKSLSTGEKKALYILNVIFEVQTRKKVDQETMMIIDDLADSFDYQNKYAIIQYLKEISEDGLFKQLDTSKNRVFCAG